MWNQKKTNFFNWTFSCFMELTANYYRKRGGEAFLTDPPKTFRFGRLFSKTFSLNPLVVFLVGSGQNYAWASWVFLCDSELNFSYRTVSRELMEERQINLNFRCQAYQRNRNYSLFILFFFFVYDQLFYRESCSDY